ncbi:MAG: tetratricopeptide repeat protein, partial [Rhodothermales bacterium]|nr:tetratricopeptide repeat protein [Rhodothermales bacterium]
NARPSDFYVTIADDLALRFRYPAAAVISQKAVDMSPTNPGALASLGTSLLRLGRVAEARRYLDRSFERDEYNLFVGNTLTLLDEYEDFRTLESSNFQLLIHKDESEVLGNEILREAELAFESMSARYPYRPSNRIFIEAYNDRDDFAVRIAGVPHLGLLGVSFGDVVAINTPRAQAGNEYNWARTLWHEIAHTMAIGVSRNKVPRWFTEGLSVYEERLAHVEWAREMEVELFTALQQDKLHPLVDIDRGFTRPEFPGQVLLSYFHASKVIEFIADTYGFEAVVSVLEALSEGQSISSAIQAATNGSIETLDRAFLSNLRTEQGAFADLMKDLPDPMAEDAANKVAESLEGSGNKFLSTLRDARAALGAGDLERAETLFEESIELYPTFVRQGNGYDGLASIYRQRGDTTSLKSILTRFLSISEYGAQQSVELASILKSTGDLEAAASYLNRSLFTDPYERAVRSELAELYVRLEDYDAVVQQRRAILALDPVDRAEALYNLADALYDSGEAEQARRSVLQSLEIAPGYREAQRLLLKIVDM